MSDLAHSHPAAIEPEPPELQERNTWISVRLFVSSTAFLYLPLVFAYLYLASLNNAGLWRPDHLKGPLGWGLGILAAVLASAALVGWARSELAHGREVSSRWLALAGLVTGILAIVLQGVEFSRLGFGPADGGYASVFVSWTGLFAVTLLLALLWLEMVVASAFRNGGNTPDSSRADLDAVSFYLSFLAGLATVTFAFLYLV